MGWDDTHPRVKVAVELGGKEEMLPVSDPRVKEALFAEYGKAVDDVTGLPRAFALALWMRDDNDAEDEKWPQAEDVSDTECRRGVFEPPPPPPKPKRRGPPYRDE